MKNVLPILIALIYIIFTLYNKSKKAQQKQQQQKPVVPHEHDQDEYRKPADIKKTLEEILIGKEPEPVPETDYMETVPESIEADEEHAVEQISNDQEILPKDNQGKNEVTEQMFAEETEQKMREYDFKEESFGFDLKMAIIYSEILKRPYF